MFAIVTKRLPGYKRYPCQLPLSSIEKGTHLVRVRGIRSSEIDEVEYRFQRIVDLVSDGSRHLTGSSNLLRLQQQLLHSLPFGDVTKDFRCTDNCPRRVFH